MYTYSGTNQTSISLKGLQISQYKTNTIIVAMETLKHSLGGKKNFELFQRPVTKPQWTQNSFLWGRGPRLFVPTRAFDQSWRRIRCHLKKTRLILKLVTNQDSNYALKGSRGKVCLIPSELVKTCLVLCTLSSDQKLLSRIGPFRFNITVRLDVSTSAKLSIRETSSSRALSSYGDSKRCNHSLLISKKRK